MSENENKKTDVLTKSDISKMVKLMSELDEKVKEAWEYFGDLLNPYGNVEMEYKIPTADSSDETPSIASEITKKVPTQDVVDRVNEVMEADDITPPRTDLVCPLCSSKVYDNRPNKNSGQYKPTSPDFTCSNIEDCSGIVQGDVRKLRKSWWLNSKDLPQDWINTTVPHDPTKDYVDTTKKVEEEDDLPFS